MKRGAAGATDPRARLDALWKAIELGRDRQDPDRVETAEDVYRRSRERLARGPEDVVVAFAGGTGSGKSSLSNAVADRALSRVAAIRPTTDRALLWSVGEPDPDLIRWLGVVDRHVISARPDLPAGLVVLDLPDHDSIRTAHRATVDAAVKVVDIMIFVLDPLKYAQRSLFEGYLRPLANHAEVVLVVLNRVDELRDGAEQQVLDDLRRLLEETGLGRARILVTSALTGRGIDELRAVLADEARSRRAVAARIGADVSRAATLLATDVDAAAELGDTAAVSTALADAADISGAVATSGAAYSERGLAITRPPVTALVAGGARRVTQPLRTPAALRLRERDGGIQDETEAVPSGGVRRRGANVALRHALRGLVDPLAESVPQTWALRLRRLAEELTDRLTHETRDALDVVAMHPPRRLWWSVVWFLWTLVELAVVVGVGWLLSLFVIAWLQLPDPPTPQLGAVPWPTVLVLGGIPLWLILRGLRSLAVRRGARRHAARTSRRLRAQVDAATEVGLRPMHAEVDARDRLLAITSSILGGSISRTG